MYWDKFSCFLGIFGLFGVWPPETVRSTAWKHLTPKRVDWDRSTKFSYSLNFHSYCMRGLQQFKRQLKTFLFGSVCASENYSYSILQSCALRRESNYSQYSGPPALPDFIFSDSDEFIGGFNQRQEEALPPQIFLTLKFVVCTALKIIEIVAT